MGTQDKVGGTVGARAPRRKQTWGRDVGMGKTQGSRGNLEGMGPDTQEERDGLTLRALGSHGRILSKGGT